MSETASHSHRHKSGFIHNHSLTIAAVLILLAWVLLYVFSNPSTHIGSFFGNAIADWTGTVVMILATKYLYEKGSAESRPLPKSILSPVLEWVRDHSLSVFLVVTGIVWIVAYARMDSEGKWGQVVGNIVSEWTQIFGVVVMTKKLIERHSKESKR